MSDVAIKIYNVSKFYKLYSSPGDRVKEALNPFGKLYHKNFYALSNINLDIKKGEILGIVGRNGCGKSTLLKLIAGILTPNTGAISVTGTISALLELGSGFNQEFTGLQNVYFYGTILGFTRNEMDAKIDSILKFADIGEFIHQKLKTYSSGMKSRLGFAVAVSVNPDILILDEVLAVGDALFQKKCYNKINELFSNNKTVLFVSHNAQVVTQFCTRAILLENGSVICDGEPKDVLALYERNLFSNEILDEPGRRDSNNLIKTHTNNPDYIDGFLHELNTISVQSNQHMATIYNYLIHNSSGETVNILDMYNTYTIEFMVKYHCHIDLVALGVQIRNLQGLLVSGANLWDYQKQIISHVNSDDAIRVKWKFRCMLVPGIYTVALSSSSNSIKEIIKTTDAISFKVRSSKKIAGGVVALDQEIIIEHADTGELLELGTF